MSYANILTYLPYSKKPLKGAKIMPEASEITTAKLEFVRDVTISYLTNVYPKPLTSLTDDVRQKAIEQHRKEINEFIKSVYSTVNKLAPSGE